MVKPVVRPIVTHPRQLWHVTMRAESGAMETVVTTASHPFFVLERSEFVAAAALKPGQTLSLHCGGTTEVVDVRVQHAAAGESFTTYNVEVAEAHTYFVGNSGTWVHNSGRLMCELLDTLYDRYKKDGLTDSQARAKLQALLDQRVKSGRLTQEAADKHWKDASRAFRPDGVYESERAYAQRVLDENPNKRVFDTPGGARSKIGPKRPPARAFGSREYDHFDDLTGIGFELNQSPWSTMDLEQLREKVDFKVEQLNKDVLLVHKRKGKVKHVRWVMTERLPSTGERGRIVARLRDDLEEARTKWPDKFSIVIRK